MSQETPDTEAGENVAKIATPEVGVSALAETEKATAAVTTEKTNEVKTDEGLAPKNYHRLF